MVMEAWVTFPEQLPTGQASPRSRLLPAGPGGWQTLCPGSPCCGSRWPAGCTGRAQDRPLLLGAVFVLLGNYKVLCVILF